MNIDAYLQFKQFVDTPPAELLIGPVRDVRSERDLDRDEFISMNIHPVSRALISDNRDSMVSRVHELEPVYRPYMFKHIPGTISRSYRYGYVHESNNKYVHMDNVEELLKIAEPAPYGNVVSGETSVDREVRDCMQVTEHDGWRAKLDYSDMDMDITINMFAGKPVQLQFNKINIYGPGGHFARHVDTPKEGVVGTLVVFGDTEYEGGDLVLENDGKEERYRNGAVAFYSSIPHRVEPVTSGYRVTATYYILETGEEVYINEDTEQDLTPLREVVDKKPIQVLQSAAPFGICLSEVYSQSEKGFKGKDIELVNKLEPHFQLSTLPVLIKYDETYGDYDDNGLSVSVYRFTEDDFVCYQSKKGSYDTPPQLECFSLSDEFGTRIKEYEQSYAEHIGNECQPGIINNVYFSRLLVVSLNPTPTVPFV